MTTKTKAKTQRLYWQDMAAAEPRLLAIEEAARRLAPLVYDVCAFTSPLVRQFVGPDRGRVEVRPCSLPEHDGGDGWHAMTLAEVDDCNPEVVTFETPGPDWLGGLLAIDVVSSHLCGLKNDAHDDCCRPDA